MTGYPDFTCHLNGLLRNIGAEDPTTSQSFSSSLSLLKGGKVVSHKQKETPTDLHFLPPQTVFIKPMPYLPSKTVAECEPLALMRNGTQYDVRHAEELKYPELALSEDILDVFHDIDLEVKERKKEEERERRKVSRKRKASSEN